MRLRMCLEEIETQKIHMEFCPVCCLTCTCSECAWRLDAVALDLKGKCQEQEKTIDKIWECQFEVLTVCTGHIDLKLAALTHSSKFKCIPPRLFRVDGRQHHIQHRI